MRRPCSRVDVVRLGEAAVGKRKVVLLCVEQTVAENLRPAQIVRRTSREIRLDGYGVVISECGGTERLIAIALHEPHRTAGCIGIHHAIEEDKRLIERVLICARVRGIAEERTSGWRGSCVCGDGESGSEGTYGGGFGGESEKVTTADRGHIRRP